MCGIAGIIVLADERDISHETLDRMGSVIMDRGPDEGGGLIRAGLGLASRRFSFVGLSDGQQPIFKEDYSVGVVYNGELFDYPDQCARQEILGHVFRSSCDTEILVTDRHFLLQGVFIGASVHPGLRGCKLLAPNRKRGDSSDFHAGGKGL